MGRLNAGNEFGATAPHELRVSGGTELTNSPSFQVDFDFQYIASGKSQDFLAELLGLIFSISLSNLPAGLRHHSLN
ncbi:MAG: hypothetical protein F6K36_15460 [Symploca sp. SIO3C6]|uniref:Uncharacterized protein n=1 Tax=Symploca sp. SIO1C4 TaxID=2607765 RepID=A0A6B3NC80_9CYAN|nr:hypothetical protein [Symploca sp. SIO3C6]NER29267.1 hypothetical protein [Symploca sp. SIO1C4]NET04546.1 hypothetical protein [Symploca sp. SIO2B6]NET48421.1 hypothetical protein [Merismopedia sp. SIO2A8]